MKGHCERCGTAFYGRSDKRFCSLTCKNRASVRRRKTTRAAVQEVDGYLHRNREILEFLMGNSSKEVFERSLLTRTGFRWEFLTGIYRNREGKIYHLVYEFAWMEFSDQRVLVVRKK